MNQGYPKRLLLLSLVSILLLFTSPFTLNSSTWKTIQVDTQKKISVEVVVNISEKRKGLGGRSHLDRGKGMLFIYDKIEEQVFWMKDMLIPIDIIWIRKGKVVHIEHSVPPPSPMVKNASLTRYGKGVYSDMVLELPAGYAREISLSKDSFIHLFP